MIGIRTVRLATFALVLLASCRDRKPPPVADAAFPVAALSASASASPAAAEPTLALAGACRVEVRAELGADPRGALDELAVAVAATRVVATWMVRPEEGRGDTVSCEPRVAVLDAAAFPKGTQTSSPPVSSGAARADGGVVRPVRTRGASVVAWGIDGEHALFYADVAAGPPSFDKALPNDFFMPSSDVYGAWIPSERAVAVVGGGRRMITRTWDECYERINEGKISWGDCTPSDRAMLFLVGERPTKSVDLPTAPGRIAGAAFGRTRGAWLVRLDHAPRGKQEGALRIGFFGPKGEALAAPVPFATGDVGAPAIAFVGDVAHVVWAKREAPSAPYRLRLLRWDGAGAVPSSVELATPAGAAFAPSLSTFGPTRVLAWMEGDDDRHGRVRAVAWSSDALPDFTAAPVLAAGSENARDPAIAVGGAGVWAVWGEFSKAQPNGVAVAARLSCGG